MATDKIAAIKIFLCAKMDVIYLSVFVKSMFVLPEPCDVSYIYWYWHYNHR